MDEKEFLFLKSTNVLESLQSDLHQCQGNILKYRYSPEYYHIQLYKGLHTVSNQILILYILQYMLYIQAT